MWVKPQMWVEPPMWGPIRVKVFLAKAPRIGSWHMKFQNIAVTLFETCDENRAKNLDAITSVSNGGDTYAILPWRACAHENAQSSQWNLCSWNMNTENGLDTCFEVLLYQVCIMHTTGSTCTMYSSACELCACLIAWTCVTPDSRVPNIDVVDCSTLYYSTSTRRARCMTYLYCVQYP